MTDPEKVLADAIHFHVGGYAYLPEEDWEATDRETARLILEAMPDHTIVKKAQAGFKWVMIPDDFEIVGPNDLSITRSGHLR